MSLVEQAYRQIIDSMTPAQKFERMAQLNAWGRWNIARRISEAEGHEPVPRRLIEEQLARVSH